MKHDSDDPRAKILGLLRLHDEQGGSPLPELDALARALERSTRETRRACDALEADGFVEGLHGGGGDKNPSYFITDLGKAHLYDLEHGAQ